MPLADSKLRIELKAGELERLTAMLNEVDWQELGFVCDGRFIFTQRSLQNCLLPDKFSRYLPLEKHKDVA